MKDDFVSVTESLLKGKYGAAYADWFIIKNKEEGAIEDKHGLPLGDTTNSVLGRVLNSN